MKLRIRKASIEPVGEIPASLLVIFNHAEEDDDVIDELGLNPALNWGYWEDRFWIVRKRDYADYDKLLTKLGFPAKIQDIGERQIYDGVASPTRDIVFADDTYFENIPIYMLTKPANDIQKRLFKKELKLHRSIHS